MLVMSVILFTGICVLIVFFAALGNRSTKQKSAIRGAVDLESKSIVEKAEQLDFELARWMVEGNKETAESISRWQQERQALLTTARTKHPWAWTEEDVRAWRVQRSKELSQRITQQAMLQMAVGVAAIIFTFGGATLLAYAHYARQGQVIGDLDADDSLIWQTPPAADAAGQWGDATSPWLDPPNLPLDGGAAPNMPLPPSAPEVPPSAPQPPSPPTVDGGAGSADPAPPSPPPLPMDVPPTSADGDNSP
jgi:hypothetical protein